MLSSFNSVSRSAIATKISSIGQSGEEIHRILCVFRRFKVDKCEVTDDLNVHDGLMHLEDVLQFLFRQIMSNITRVKDITLNTAKKTLPTLPQGINWEKSKF